MKEEFIPWLDYVICPNCNEKVKLPKNWGLNIKPSKKVIEGRVVFINNFKSNSVHTHITQVIFW